MTPPYGDQWVSIGRYKEAFFAFLCIYMYMALIAIWDLTQNFKSKNFSKNFSNWAKRYPPSNSQGFKPFRIVVQKFSRSRDRAACFFCSGPYIWIIWHYIFNKVDRLRLQSNSICNSLSLELTAYLKINTRYRTTGLRLFKPELNSIHGC